MGDRASIRKVVPFEHACTPCAARTSGLSRCLTPIARLELARSLFDVPAEVVLEKSDNETAPEDRKALHAQCGNCDGTGLRARPTIPAVLVAAAAVGVFLLSHFVAHSRSGVHDDNAEIAEVVCDVSALVFVTALASLFRSPRCSFCCGTGKVRISRVATPYLWREDRERLQAGNRCRHCGYDLTANTSGRCPECGTEVL
jgi:hypothetical protein